MQSVPSHEEVERAIRSVPGVLDATVARAEDTGRGRLRIRLAPGEDPERVSWSVAATLRERFDIVLDPAEIRPRLTAITREASDDGDADDAPGATTESEGAEGTGQGGAASADENGGSTIVIDTPSPPVAGKAGAATRPTNGEATRQPDGDAVRVPSGPWRPAIRDLGSRNDGVALTVTATLEFDGRQTAGEASGMPTTRGLHRAIAEATLSALGQLTSSPLRAQVDRVTVGEADPAAVNVVVSFLSDRGEELLLGASIVRGDVEHAVMRAALDAVNRRVEPQLAVEV